MSTSPRSLAVKRDWGHDETGCTVLHIDMDAFYASCEIARHPELKGKPVIIGTGNRAVVSAASYEARTYGINSAMAVATARRRCPQGIFLPVDMQYYRAISRQIFTLMASVTDQIEQVSVDEAYMNVSQALRRWESPSAIGAWIRHQVQENFNVTCSVGIAANKLIAKLASTNAKPDGMLLVPLSQHATFIRMLPLRSIPGIGPASAEHFRRWGVETVEELSLLSESQIAQITGSTLQAHSLWLAAQGRDERKVIPHTPEKSIGSERTFAQDTTDSAEVTALLRHCSDEVAASLRKRGLVARTITTKVRHSDLSYSTKARTLEAPVDMASAIYPVAKKLLFAIMKTESTVSVLPQPLRLAGVSASGLSPAKTTALQPSLELDLGDEDEEETAAHADATKLRTAEKTLDSIRNKYGKNVIHLGTAAKAKEKL